jgi:hypothetical protein
VALLERLDAANREHLFPALADGQGAFVMDLEAKSQKWFEQMPESPKPLPMFELALVSSVSDAEKLRKGVTNFTRIRYPNSGASIRKWPSMSASPIPLPPPA